MAACQNQNSKLHQNKNHPTVAFLPGLAPTDDHRGRSHHPPSHSQLPHNIKVPISVADIIIINLCYDPLIAKECPYLFFLRQDGKFFSFATRT